MRGRLYLLVGPGKRPYRLALRGDHCEGTIYRKNQDPWNRLGLRLLFAPDACQGPDGRYYLYYAFDFMGVMGVAVASSPAGPFEFLGHVSYADGTVWGRRAGDQLPFDPGVLVDKDGRVWLYSGFYTPVPAIATGGRKLRNDGGVVMELEPDMVTIKTEPRVIFPKSGPGSWAGHEFFEASSIRRYGDTYVFVYSSAVNHELCYAVSNRPDGGFEFGGVLVSLGDVGLPGHPDEAHAANYLGNTHGGMLRIEHEDAPDDWYIFYHRQTNRSSYARQACAERLEGDPFTGFKQAEVTSCGLNAGPFAGRGGYEARIACNLWSSTGTGRYDGPSPRRSLAAHPYVTQAGHGHDAYQYIANMRDGAVAGFKYFDLRRTLGVAVTVRGAAGRMEVATSPDFSELVAVMPLEPAREWRTFRAGLAVEATGKDALYFRYAGKGAADFLAFDLS